MKYTVTVEESYTVQVEADNEVEAGDIALEMVDRGEAGDGILDLCITPEEVGPSSPALDYDPLND